MSIPKPIILDISEWQVPGSINYDQLAKAIGGVIVRVQYGSNYVDKHYKTHIKEFQKRGIPVAVYAWVRGVNNEDMEKEATDFYNRAKEFNPVFWWLDVEEYSMSDMRTGCEKFRARLKALGAKKVGAYIANHMYHGLNLDTSKFDGVWIPTYGSNNGQYNGSNPTATWSYDIHQYTSNGKLSGYNGPLDLNRIVNVGKSFEYYFGSKSVLEKPAAINTADNQVEKTEGKIKLKTIKLSTDVYLRTKADKNSAAIALLKKSEKVNFDDVIVAGGYMWGRQPRKDKYKVGYISLGKIEPHGTIS